MLLQHLLRLLGLQRISSQSTEPAPEVQPIITELPPHFHRWSNKVQELMAKSTLEGPETTLKLCLIEKLTYQLPLPHQEILKFIAPLHYLDSDRSYLQITLESTLKAKLSLPNLERFLEDLGSLGILEIHWWYEGLDRNATNPHWRLSPLGVEVVRVLLPDTFDPPFPTPLIPSAYEQLTDAMRLGSRYGYHTDVPEQHKACLRCNYYNKVDRSAPLRCAVHPDLWNWCQSNCPDFDGTLQPTLQEVLPTNQQINQHRNTLKALAQRLHWSMEDMDFSTLDVMIAWRWLNLTEAQQLINAAIQSLDRSLYHHQIVTIPDSYQDEYRWQQAESLTWQKNRLRPLSEHEIG